MHRPFMHRKIKYSFKKKKIFQVLCVNFFIKIYVLVFLKEKFL